MSPFSTVRAGAEAAIEEVVANAIVRQRFPAFITSQAAELFTYADDKAHIKRELSTLLGLGSPDPAVVNRGLIIQLNGIFEGFTKALASARINEFSSKKESFHDLDDEFRSHYAVHAARVLVKMGDGSINGMKYNFDLLQERMGSCFSGVSPFTMDGDVFTLLMGNCTPDRLERLFKQIRLPEPFGDNFGKHKAAQKWSGEASSRRTATRAREELEKQIENRNDIVHGFATKDVVLQDVQDSADFFQCLVTVYADLAEGAT